MTLTYPNRDFKVTGYIHRQYLRNHAWQTPQTIYFLNLQASMEILSVSDSQEVASDRQDQVIFGKHRFENS